MTGKTIAVIPARGGSRRIPRKNIIDFCGRPLLAWSVEAALESGAFHRVLVSTEDEEIAEIARACGAEAPFLRKTAFDHVAGVGEAVAAAVEQAEAHYAERYDAAALLMPTCPLRTAADIRHALDTFQSRGAAFQISAMSLGKIYHTSALGVGDDGRPVLFPQAEEWRNPDKRPTLLQPTGAVWIARRDALLDVRDFYGPGWTMLEIPWDSAIDIDTFDDLDRARAAWIARRTATTPGRPG